MNRILLLITVILVAYILLYTPSDHPRQPYATANAQSEFSCANVTEIPQLECEALVAIYDAAGGAFYGNGTEIFYDADAWLANTNPCNWIHVGCSAGHVTRLNLDGHYEYYMYHDDIIPAVQPLTYLPPEIGNLTALTSLILSRNQLTTLPPEIGDLSSLSYLNLSLNQLTKLPSEIGHLSALNSLDLSSNQLMTFPPEIGNLSLLTKLSLSTNRLSVLPSEIGNLQSIQHLYLDENLLTTLPSGISNLWRLTVLDIDDNQLTTLPAELGDLISLWELNVRNNWLTELPAEIGKLSSLTSLRLDSNQLSSLPEETATLFSLVKLSLNDNQLAVLTPTIGNLQKLKELYLNQNQLTNLPAEVGELLSLERLEVSHNQLTSLPPEIGNLPILFDLKANNNLLTSLPLGIENISYSDIEVSGNPLDISLVKMSVDTQGNGKVERSIDAYYYIDGTMVELTAIPDAGWQFVRWDGSTDLGAQSTEAAITVRAGGELTAVFELTGSTPVFDCDAVDDISLDECNALATIYTVNFPDAHMRGWTTAVSPCQWSGVSCVDGHVTQLDLEACDLTQIPTEISSLSWLTDLNIASNPLESALPESIATLSQLDTLDMSGLNLIAVPAWLWSLSSLEDLDLADNALADLPEEWGLLKYLERLDVAFNSKLLSLPESVMTHPSLKSVQMTGTDIALTGKVSIYTHGRGRIVRDRVAHFYPSDTSLTLTAQPEAGWRFVNWDIQEGGWDLLERNHALYTQAMITIPLSNAADFFGESSVHIKAIFQPTSFDCNRIQDITTAECVGLVDIVSSNPLSDFGNWMTTDAICSWDGVTCVNGRVTKLDLSQKNIAIIPWGIRFLSKLIKLNLADNQLTEVPFSLWTLASLDVLDMSGNQLDQLSVDVRNLTALTSLDLSFNEVAIVPPEIGKLSGLTKLNLGGNQLTHVPSELWTLNALENLYLSGNQLTTITPEIGSLANLTQLGLSYNQLTALPAEIGNLTKLKMLKLHRNDLTSLPASLGNLTQLTDLTLTDNQLTSVPEEMAGLSSEVVLMLRYEGLLEGQLFGIYLPVLAGQ